jgi:HlyD family secretion protein
MKKILIVFIIMVSLPFCSGKKSSEIKAPGIIEGDIITLKSLVAGTIEQIFISEGEQVKQNQRLITINQEKVQNQIEELTISQKELQLNIEKLQKKTKLLKANQQYLKKQVQRFLRLREKKSISGEKLETMQLKLLEAETSWFDIQKTIASLQVQKEKILNKKEYLKLIIRDHNILSPVNGIITGKYVLPGENVFPNSPLLDILDTSGMYIDIFIEESEIASLALKQKARILIDGLDHKDLFGEIVFFGKKAEFSPKYVISEKERKSLLYRVKIAISGNYEIYKIGMPVTVILSRGKP